MSGRKNVIIPNKIGSAEDLSTSFTSQSTNIQYLDRVAYSIIATTADAIGEFTLQGRVSPSAALGDNNGPAAEWADLDTDPMQLAGSSEIFVIDVIQTGLIETRIKWVPTSGTGQFDIWVSAKEV